jgi:hypothetical protein
MGRVGFTLCVDAARRELNCAYNEQLQARSAAWMAAWARGEETPCDPKSSEDEEEEEGEVTPPPLSPSCKALPSFGDILSRQVSVTVGTCHPNRDRAIGQPAAVAPPHARIY